LGVLINIRQSALPPGLRQQFIQAGNIRFVQFITRASKPQEQKQLKET
jgi:hypothetical protein